MRRERERAERVFTPPGTGADRLQRPLRPRFQARLKPRDLQTPAAVLLSDSAWCETSSTSQASLAADGYAWVVCCDRR
jgi:hypothetical protein